MLSRRRFLALSAWAVPCLAVRPRWSRTPVLRVGTRIDTTRPDFERGLAFGAAEADRSARLFGWTVERVALAPETAIDEASLPAVIMAVTGSAPNDKTLTLRLVCDGEHREDGSFMLAPCETNATGDVWRSTLERFGAAQLNDRYRAATGVGMTGDAWLGWFAFKVVVDSALKLRSADPEALRAYLKRPTTVFDGHKGIGLRFDASRRLVQPLATKDGAS